ncbi:MAG: hypothetical protein LBF68_05890, partial [Christensenellaceae bacterium]|nr:hypothetical protein [Christensenellaceae bacterium]
MNNKNRKIIKINSIFKHTVLFFILLFTFCFLFIIHNQSIKPILNNIAGDFINSKSDLNIDTARADVDHSFNATVVTLTEVDTTSDFYLGTAFCYWNGGGIITSNILGRIFFGGDLKKAITSKRVTIKFTIKVTVEFSSESVNNWGFHIRDGKYTYIPTDFTVRDQLTKMRDTFDLHNTYYTNDHFEKVDRNNTELFTQDTPELDMSNYVDSHYGIFVHGGINWPNKKARCNIKSVYISYTTTTNYLPTVNYQTTLANSIENITGLKPNKELSLITINSSANAKLMDNYYFTGWTGSDTKSTNAIQQNKMQVILKKPLDITYSSPDTLNIKANYTAITVIGSDTFNYSRNQSAGITQGPYVNNIAGYTVTNYYGTSSVSLFSSSNSPFSSVGTYYFKSTISKDGEIVGQTNIRTFTITQATFDLGAELYTLNINYGESLKDKTTYFNNYKPTYQNILVDGKFVWEYPDTVLPYGNTSSCKFTFEPTDSLNFKYIESTLPASKINVALGKLQILDTSFTYDALESGPNSWDQINKITYGQSLNDILLKVRSFYFIANQYVVNKTIIAGEWMLYKGEVPSPGHNYANDKPNVSDSNTEYTLKFVPDQNPSYYAVLEKNLKIIVEKATPGADLNQSNIQIGDLIYGKSISDISNSISLNTDYYDSSNRKVLAGFYYNANNVTLAEGSTIVSGIWVWFEKNDAAVTGYPDAGLKEYTLRYIPNDLANYNITYIGSKNFIIDKAAPILGVGIHEVNSDVITYGAPLIEATFLSDSNNKVYNPYNNLVVSGNWYWYTADMQNKFIENVNYPTYIDGGEGSGKYWNV